MRYIGIDFGSKNIGVAISSEDNVMAFPLQILKNNKDAFNALEKLIAEKKITDIVIGDSQNYKGGDNLIMKKAREFSVKLQPLGNFKIHWEPEFLTSAEAERLQGVGEKLDASAAALILKSFLEKQRTK